jgi:uncharacterized protein (DUF488 family)
MHQQPPAPLAVVRTIGHSILPIETFVDILCSHGIKLLADVRTVPRSRHNPQFNQESLPDSLAAAGIKYLHMPGLGGYRHARRDSVNTGWKNDSFRGYADYMQTPEFVENVDRLVELAPRLPLAIMCAEAVPWRCHRSLIADALTVRGVLVEHIFSAQKRSQHALTPWAHIEGQQITYPPETLSLGLESNK